MKRLRLRFFLLVATTAAVVAVAGGCDTYEPAGVGPQYVVEAYLEAGAPLPPVRLSRTAPVGESYDFTALAVSGAEVRIERLDADGTPIGAAVRYAEAPDSTGLYWPEPGNAVSHQSNQDFQDARAVEPLGRYRLEVTGLPSGDGIAAERVTAETVVPDTFRIVETSGEALRWQQDELAVTLTQSAYPGRRARYVVSTQALAPTRENLTPLAAQILERAGEGDLTIEELSLTESPVINEGNYESDANGQITIDIPWLVANFYGTNEVSIRALGDNYYDFLRSQSVQQGGSTFSPGEIPNVIERVAGGTGLFGSYAGVQYRLEVEPPEGIDLP